MSVKKEIHVFDFDGTLTKKSTVALFLLKSSSIGALIRHAHVLFKSWMDYRQGKKTYEETLAEAASWLLKGKTQDYLTQQGQWCCQCLLKSHGFWSTTVRAWEQALKKNEPVIIITGGLPFIAQAWAETWKGDIEVHGTEVLWDQGRLARIGAVCVNQEKVNVLNRIKKHRMSTETTINAYGNSSGDVELLHAADRAYWVEKTGEINPFKPHS